MSYNRSWLKDTIERDIAAYKKTIGVELPFDSMYNIWKENWSWGVHHLICGLIPIPAAHGGGSWSFVATRHTASLELGFEIYDTISRI